MTKITPLTIFILSLIVITNTFISPSAAVISDERLCYDEKCSEPVSLAKTLSKYFSNDKDILSFRANADAKVFSKSAGKRSDLWGVEILGKRGYVPKNLLREYRVLKKQLSFIVPTELLKQNVPKVENSQIAEENTANQTVEKNSETPLADSSQDSSKISEEPSSSSPSEKSKASVIDSSTKDMEHSVPIPENVSPSYKVVDGTTIHFLPNELPSDYPSQPVEDATQYQEPVLTVHPHDSLVSSTISFVSNVFDRVAERFDKAEEETDKVISGSENSEPSREIKEEQKEILMEEEVKHEKLKDESKDEASKKVENKKEEDGVKQDESVNLKSEDQVNLEVKEAEEEPKVVDPVEEEDDSEETEEEEESEEDIEDEADVEDEEVEKTIPEEKNLVVNSEALKTKSEFESVKSSETENEINPKVDINNNEEVTFTNDQDFSVKDKVASETVSLSEGISVEEATSDTLEKKVPLPVVLIEEQVPKLQENGTQAENENKDLKAENLVPEAQNLNEENINATSEILEQDVLDNQIPELEAVYNSSLNASDTINEVKQNVNIVDSDNNVNKENETGAESFQSLKMNNLIQEEVTSNPKDDSSTLKSLEPHFHEGVESHSGQQILAAKQVSSFNEFPTNRNLLNVDEGSQYDSQESQSDQQVPINEIDQTDILSTPLNEENTSSEEKPLVDSLFDRQDLGQESKMLPPSILPPEVCGEKDFDCPKENVYQSDVNAITYGVNMGRNYWEFLVYLVVTSVTILIFSLGYYYIENARRDSQLIAKINKLEKELMVSTKECILLNENLTFTKTKLNSIEDESFGSNEMVASLKDDLEASQNAKLELEDQVATLEKELESATEAGLELERMLREFLSSNNEDNPLAQSVEDLQARLNAQQAENEALTSALNLKKQEHDFDKLQTEGLSSELLSFKRNYEKLEIEVGRLEEELKTQGNMKIYMEQSWQDKVQRLEMQIREMMEERSQLRKGLKAKELEVNHLLEVVDQENSNNLDFDKLYNAVQIKAEALQLAEERDELQMKLKDVQDARQLMEENIRFAKEEVVSLTEQCRFFEKERKDAETKLEVLSNFFKEKEAERQKEEAAWLQKQGEVSSTVERIHTMQNEIQNYKQQIEILKREIVDQEREYKNQIGSLETKAHEHWVVARQNERRLEELKAESGQLRNRLTLVEQSMNDPDPEVKLHRMEANGETATSPSLFLGADSSSSPIMFSNTSGVPPPPPPSYMFGPPFHPYFTPLPPGPAGMPPFDVGQRPPPLGGRLSSPPPPSLPLQPPSSGRYENTGSPPPPSPPLPPHYGHHRSPPLPFINDRIHPPPPPPPSLVPFPHLSSLHNWGEESLLPPLRNSGFHQRDQRARNHKGSLHSSGESLDKSHHSGKV